MSPERQTPNHEQLERNVDKRVARMRRAEREQRTLLAQTAYLGTLGLVFVLPVVAGAYLGQWLDDLVSGYSLRWTLGLIFLGIVIGAINVYLLVRE